MSSSTSSKENPSLPTETIGPDSNDPTVFRRMLAGAPYNAADPHVQHQAQVGRDKVHAINEAKDGKERMALFSKWAQMGPKGNAYVALPFFCEYVFNLTIGDDVYIGPGNTFLDVTPIKIGNGCQIGPSCHLYTPGHPVDPEERRTYIEWATPITLEDNVWLGGNVTILGGVTIGAGSTVGAGSVVTKSVPPRSVVVGNPARVIKTLPIRKEGDESEADKRIREMGL